MKRFWTLAVMLTIYSVSCFAQNGGFRIVTGHPDFKIKIQRCEASGSTCVIDMLITNTGVNDVKADIIGGYGTDASKAYDDEGNVYMNNNVRVGYGANAPRTNGYIIDLPAGAPIKVRIQIDGVASYAKLFTRLDLDVDCPAWGLHTHQGKPVKMYNIPISRDGD